MILSLCSGIGALDLAVERLTGQRLALYAEIDPHASAVMATHFPGVPNLGDITRADWQAVAEDHPEVTTITAGFPCQDISSAGTREGINGKRSGVWKSVADAIRILRPEIAFLENVAAIRTRGLDIVAADLAANGYDLQWTSLRASDIGAPHRRDRWFGIAIAQNADRATGQKRRPPAPGRTEVRHREISGGGGGGARSHP
ncbi:DNA cytosine methyltransferase [Streptomyces sp. KK5PA1]|uniref:DNA (cytosine-5-)-methyltransferase n=1 Tax=Actinacidiphila acididurans TaxID=2784346 RepID=A0ABS2TNG1_9ACTN|nr:DNA cytosine methyltransferase [Actinacidiphila acididurans]